MRPAPIAFSPPGRPLARYRLSRAEAEAAYGPPQYEPGGPRSLPAWGLELECGLIVEIQLDEGAQVALLHTEPRELPHALLHMEIEARLEWRADQDADEWLRALEEYHPLAWGRWTVVERAGGARQVCLSPQEARCRLGARPEDAEPAYIEEAAVSEARARRRKLLASPVVKRRTRGRPRPRYEVWMVHADGAESLVDLVADRAEADRRVARLTPARDARVEVRDRARRADSNCAT